MARHKWNHNRLFSQGVCPNVGEQPTLFEKTVKALGLTTEQQMADSVKLRQWVRRHRHKYFVPESLLTHWGFDVRSGSGFYER
jgi:hypothetical protein